MKITFYDTHGFEREFFKKANEQYNFEIEFLETRLTAKTAFLATGSDVVCSFVNDKIDADCVKVLSEAHVNLIVLRSVGFNHVDVAAAQARNILVARVPEYSPYAVAEFAIGLLLTLNRKIHRAHARVRELNFSLDGLVGFDLHGKTVGIIGTGKIGHIMCQIMLGFGCKILAYDLKNNLNLENDSAVRYCDLETLCKNSDIISLHVPLTAATFHLINEQRIEEMKNGVFIINTGRGALIDAKALIKGLKSEKIGGAALDVYEEEEEIFFHDLSDKMLKDDNLARQLTIPNVLITSHQAFLTQEALNTIAQTTLKSVFEFQNTKSVSADKVVKVNV
jgi:D-lactate dehydrogenase